MNTMTRTRKLVEAALMVAIATVLSLIQFPGPWVNGGSITLCSMLPICIIAYRHGPKWGLLSGLVYGILQMFLGINGLKGITLGTFIAAVVLDYLLAFTVLGLAGIFRRVIRNQTAALAAGTAFVCVLRFFCHFLSGFLVWDSLVAAGSVNWTGIVYSLSYNGSYMLPELIITTAAAAILSKLIHLDSPNLKKA